MIGEEGKPRIKHESVWNTFFMKPIETKETEKTAWSNKQEYINTINDDNNKSMVTPQQVFGEQSKTTNTYSNDSNSIIKKIVKLLLKEIYLATVNYKKLLIYPIHSFF